MKLQASLVLKSRNPKTGPIPVSYTESSSCPPSCAMYRACYAKAGPSRMHWGSVDSGRSGADWVSFCDSVENLPDGQVWRHNVAGDLPGVGEKINGRALAQLVEANRGKRGFTYTHKRPEVGRNAAYIQAANLQGFTINLSANSVSDVDRLVGLGIGPVVTVLPAGSPDVLKTAGGVVVVTCPAVTRGLTCEKCKLCALPGRKFVIGFPAHGSRSKLASEIAKGAPNGAQTTRAHGPERGIK